MQVGPAIKVPIGHIVAPAQDIIPAHLIKFPRKLVPFVLIQVFSFF